MSYFLPHLPSGWHVDEAIKSEEDRIVVIRFGHDWDPQCMKMDETLYAVAEKVQNFAVIYLVDITNVPDFNKVRVIRTISLRLFLQPLFSYLSSFLSNDKRQGLMRMPFLGFRCMNFTTPALSCSSIGTYPLVL